LKCSKEGLALVSKSIASKENQNLTQGANGKRQHGKITLTIWKYNRLKGKTHTISKKKFCKLSTKSNLGEKPPKPNIGRQKDQMQWKLMQAPEKILKSQYGLKQPQI
jgi:hypothetical protein